MKHDVNATTTKLIIEGAAPPVEPLGHELCRLTIIHWHVGPSRRRGSGVAWPGDAADCNPCACPRGHPLFNDVGRLLRLYGAYMLHGALHAAVDLPAQTEANQARNYKRYTETAWHESPSHLRGVHLPQHAIAAAGAAQQPAWYHNRARRVQFEAATMGMKVCVSSVFPLWSRLPYSTQFMTDEVQHCLEAVPGRSYTVESVVSTTAKYGDKFKTLVRYWCARLCPVIFCCFSYCACCSMHRQCVFVAPCHESCKPAYNHVISSIHNSPPRYTAQSQEACELQVAYSVVMLQPVPKLVRPMILKGADSGLKKNFATVVDLLQRRCVVKALRPGGARGSWVEQAPSPAEVGQPGWALTVGLTGELLAAMRPWARAAIGLPVVGGVVGVDTLCTLLSCVALLSTALAVVGTLTLLQRLCASTPGTCT